MLYLALADALVAIAMGLWLRALVRARGGEVPCRGGKDSMGLVAAGSGAVFAFLVANVIAMTRLDAGTELSFPLFALVVAGSLVAGFLFMAAIATRNANRTAAAWIRLVAPDTLSLRSGGETRRIKLGAATVTATGTITVDKVEYVKYELRDGERTVGLLVPYVGGVPVDRTRRPVDATGLFVHGATYELHRAFAAFVVPR